MGDVVSTADISPCGRYRYRLQRRWASYARTATFVMLNPSTADATTDDATVRRCLGFARAWGCGTLTVVNLFALRSTDPDALRSADDPVGPGGDAALRRALASVDGPLVVAWGARGGLLGRDLAVLAMAREARAAPSCLGVLASGQPRHPLYARADAALAPYAGRTIG